MCNYVTNLFIPVLLRCIDAGDHCSLLAFTPGKKLLYSLLIKNVKTPFNSEDIAGGNLGPMLGVGLCAILAAVPFEPERKQ